MNYLSNVEVERSRDIGLGVLWELTSTSFERIIGFSFAGHPVALPLLEMTVAQTFSIYTIWGTNQKGHHSRRSDRRRDRCCASVFVTLLVGKSYFSFDPFGFIKALRLHHQGH